MIVVANCYSDDNRGSAALNLAAIRFCREITPCGEEIALVAIRAGETASRFSTTRARHPDVEIHEPPLRLDGSSAENARRALRAVATLVAPRAGRDPAVDAVRRARVVVSRGGVIFAAPRGLGGALQLFARLYPLLLAVRLRKPVVLLGAHARPLSSRAGRLVARQVLRGAALVLPRDGASAQVLVGLGAPPERVSTVPDSVLLLADDVDPGASIRLLEELGLAGSRFAVLSLGQDLGDEVARTQREAVVAALVAAASELRAAGLLEHVLVVPHVSSEVAVNEQLCERITSEGGVPSSLLDPPVGPAELASLYGRAAFVASFRMHAAILALVGGGVGFPLEITGDHRKPATFEQLGLGDLVVGPELLVPGVLAERIAAVLGDDGADARDRVARLRATAGPELAAIARLVAQDVPNSSCSSGTGSASTCS